MEYLEYSTKPSKIEQELALKSYRALSIILARTHNTAAEIEIEDTEDKIKISRNTLLLLAKVLKVTSQGKPISIVPASTEITTQAAADLLACSRPYLVKLLEKGEIAHTKVGKHRRVKLEDVITYKKQMKAKQEELLIKIMQADEATALYDV